MRKNKGFTLIELLIVLTILAILAAVVTLALVGFIGRGSTEACKVDHYNVQLATSAWHIDNYPNWPTTDPDLGPGVVDFNNLVPELILEVPTTGQAGGCNWTVGSDGVVYANPGGEDDCPCAEDYLPPSP